MAEVIDVDADDTNNGGLERETRNQKPETRERTSPPVLVSVLGCWLSMRRWRNGKHY